VRATGAGAVNLSSRNSERDGSQLG